MKAIEQGDDEKLGEAAAPVVAAIITAVVTGKLAGAAEEVGVTPVKGSFSIVDWTGYPEGVPKPSGPFVLLEGEEYAAARAGANGANRMMLNDAQQRPIA